MIGKLTGRVDFIAADHVVIDVNGVGYVVHCPATTLSKLPAPGGQASLAVETRVSEDAIRLYGFASTEEREWFRLLQTVQGVGARVALGVLSTLSVRELERAVALGDKAVIGRAQGVGPKLALRIATELKDKAPAIILRGHPANGTMGVAHAARPAEADAVAALVKLGYSQGVAAEAVMRAGSETGDAALETLIRESLRAMGRG